MSGEPLVSVVMPMRDAGAFVEEAVSSVLAQTLRDFELLVVDDGSKDDGPRRLEGLLARDNRIQLLSCPGRGIVDALNAGCGTARGRYIARMDADDVALAPRLERQVALLQARPEIGIVGGQMDCADDRGRITWRAVYPLDDGAIRAMSNEKNPFAHPTVMFRKDVFERAGGFRRTCRDAEDYDLWCRMLDHSRGANLDEVVVRYRVHKGQSTLVRARQQTLSSLAVAAANPVRCATGRDPLAEHELITEQVVFELGVAPEAVRAALVESFVGVARHARRLREIRLARRSLDDALALASSGPLPPERATDLWRALGAEGLLLGHVAALRSAGDHGVRALDAGERALPRLAAARSWWATASRRVGTAAGRIDEGRRRLHAVVTRGADGADAPVAPETAPPPPPGDDPGDIPALPVPLGEEWWRADLELSIWAWHAGEVDAGRRACERLLSGRRLPEAVAATARSNQTWYVPLLAEWVESVTFSHLPAPVREGWSSFNPSVATDGHELRAIVRSANYRLTEDLGYELLDPAGVIRTENYLVSLDDELRVLDARRLAPPTTRAAVLSDFPVRGYEDCRLFASDGKWHALATVRDRDREGWCRMVLLHLEDAAVARETLLRGPQPRRHEKNWVPFPHEDRTLLVYSWEPTVVLALDLDSGRWEEAARHSSSGLSRDVRGGTPGVAVGNGWVFLVHECVWMPDGRRRYPHRFVHLGSDLQVRAVGRPFFFLERSIEFAAGLALDHDDLVVSFGVEDATAWCARVPLEAVLENLARDRACALVPGEAQRAPGRRETTQ